MTHITGHDRSQTLLLPEALDDYVGRENPVRFMFLATSGVAWWWLRRGTAIPQSRYAVPCNTTSSRRHTLKCPADTSRNGGRSTAQAASA